MELWIRSQNKGALMKAEILGNTEGTINTYSNDNQIVLGEYSSDERALEVLDEIQKLIKPSIINTKYNCEIKDGHNKNEFDVVMQPDDSKFEIIQPTAIVYEMPKE